MKDIKFPARTRASMGDMPKEATPTPPPDAPKVIQFKKFPNGAVMLHSPNPSKPGTRVIHDATGTPLGVILNSDVADIICRGVTFLFMKMEEAEAARAAAAAELTNAIPNMSDTSSSSSSSSSDQSGQPDSSITPPLPPPFVPLPDPQLPPLDPPVVNPDPINPNPPPQEIGDPSYSNPKPADPLNPPPDVP